MRCSILSKKKKTIIKRIYFNSTSIRLPRRWSRLTLQQNTSIILCARAVFARHRRPPSLLLRSDPNDVSTQFTVRYVENSVGFQRQTFEKSHCFQLVHPVPRKPRYARFAATNAHYNTCEQLCRIFWIAYIHCFGVHTLTLYRGASCFVGQNRSGKTTTNWRRLLQMF